MRFEKMFFVVDSHTAGEGTRLVTGGMPPIPGKSMLDKVKYFKENLDFVQTSLTREPRIHQHIVGAVITPPVTEKGDFGVFFMNENMCIHATIGVVTSLIECGMISPVEPVTEVNLDTPVGLVTAHAHIQNCSVKSVTIRNVPCFLHTVITIGLQKMKKFDIPINIAFGGNFYAILNSDDVDVEVLPENIHKLTEISFMASQAIDIELKRQGIEVQHPEIPHVKWSGYCIVYGKPMRPDSNAKNFTIGFRDNMNIASAFWDRSPCGTGTCARMGMEYAHDRLKLNQEFVNESIIGSIFRGKLTSSAKVGKYVAAIPEITGSAYITAISTHVMDPDDPFKHGFLSTLPNTSTR